ncbi:MAG: DUF1588 domain-containing protein [Nannocystaceae bacterium]|nr:DUF1588 domain-containing protein [Nannocystaceae bacterium]
MSYAARPSGPPLLALLLATSACRDGAGAAASAGADDGTGATTIATGDDDSGGDVPPGSECTAAVPRALRLLTRREYERTVLALVPLSQDGDAISCEADAQCELATQSCVGGSCQDDPCSLHTFVLADPGHAHAQVVVAGDFNGWAATAADGGWPLDYVDAAGAWVGKRVIADGHHAYKFVVDGSWQTDPNNDAHEPDGVGGDNSVLELHCDGAPAGDDGDANDDDAHPARAFPVESRTPGFPFDDGVASGLVTTVHVEQYLRAAERIAARATADLAALLPCDPASFDRSCAEAFVADFGARALRRPLQHDELAAYADRMMAQQGAATAAAVVIRVLLSSPMFLYRMEIGTVGDDGTATLDAYERAGVLAYGLWGGPPDATLLQAAATGALDSDEGVLAQAQAMLDDPRAHEALTAFASQWLDVEHVAELERNASFIDFDAVLAAQMAAESRDSLARIVLEDDARWHSLWLATDTVVGPQLAALYGVPFDGAAPQRVELPPERRAGLLAQAGVLARYAHSDRTSPVRRGVFVLERLLCQGVPPPPAVVPSIGEIDPGQTAREVLAQHTADPACSGCHEHFDPIGLGFEHFDAIGRWRDDDAGAPIDASGWIPGLDGRDQADFADVPGLAAIVADSPTAQRCFVQQVHRFTAGALERDEDACRIDALTTDFAAQDHDLRALFARTVAAWAVAPRQP